MYDYNYLADLMSDHFNENHIQDNLGIGLGQLGGAKVLRLS